MELSEGVDRFVFQQLATYFIIFYYIIIEVPFM